MTTEENYATWLQFQKDCTLRIPPFICGGCGSELDAEDLDYSVWSTSFLTIRDYCSKSCMQVDIELFEHPRVEQPGYYDDLIERMKDVKEYGRSSVYNARTSVFYRN